MQELKCWPKKGNLKVLQIKLNISKNLLLLDVSEAGYPCHITPAISPM